MKRRLFGTDGIRGTANKDPVTAEVALSLAVAVGTFFRRGQHRHQVVIGKDTRLSCYMLEAALTSGLAAAGMDVVLLGPIPTPAVAMLTRSLKADLGIMISASHNPYEDNGIKLFGPDGFKLSDADESSIEALMDEDPKVLRADNDKMGRVTRLEGAFGRYVEFCKYSFPRHLRLDGMKIVLDCANGATYKVAPLILDELGAEVIPIGTAPNGFNINEACGAVYPQAMQNAVLEKGAHLGIALDGDGDRLILADEKGAIIDGDQVMAVIARYWQESGALKGGGIVATVMSNLALENYLESHGLDLYRTPVGDRYVVQHMRKHNYNLGGEQSGHLIMSDYTTTGDGIIAALQILAVLAQSEKPASEVARVFQPLPQVLRSVRLQNSISLKDENVLRIIAQAEASLQDKGRLLIRKSGTEPVVRIMAEGENGAFIEELVDAIAEAIERAGVKLSPVPKAF